MSLVGELTRQGGSGGKPAPVVLGEDWAEAAQRRDAAPEARDWFRVQSSPLARKIITFNLLALLVLVAGVLYLNPFRDSLLQMRERSLQVEARLIAELYAVAPGSGGLAAEGSLADAAEAAALLRRVSLPPGAEVFVFDRDGGLRASARGAPDRTAATAPQGTVITDFFNRLWEGTARLIAPARMTAPVIRQEDQARAVIPRALSGDATTQTARNEQGELIFTVATPIRRDGVVIGALAVTTVSGEIDHIVRAEREQVLQMFLIALLVSIGLSLVLASTIANPLRDLAAAARAGRERNARKMSPSRVRIPDFTARPDEIGRLSGALRDMVAALYDKIEANEQFAADVAHEIKNPLSSLRSAVETMRVARTQEQRGRLLEVIEDDVRRLDRLVSDISNASRLDSELVKEETEAFDIVRMLTNVGNYHRHEARERGVDFIVDLPVDPVMINGLEARLAQVFVNLLTNAISFCEAGDAVRIWARRREDRVLVVVEDTGPGIPEAALEKIFSRFYSERPAGDFGKHSGLGLAISKQIVEAHNGVIWAENIRPTDADPTSEPLGARFVVGLPM